MPDSEIPLAVTFDAFDKLERKPFCQRLETFIQVERVFVEGSLVISLNSEFGTGKTAFLKMWQSDLVERRQGDENLPMPILLNAWEDDFCGDPLIAIVSGLMAVLEKQNSDSPEPTKKKALWKAAEEVVRFGFIAANQIVTNQIGVNLNEAQQQAREETVGGKEEPSPRFIQQFRDRQHALHRLKDALNDCFPMEGDAKAVVFVDELDRCRPNYAVEYLETIKHVFDVRGITFVLAIDKKQLKSSASALFGDSMDFEGYFRKFVHRQIGFPREAPHLEARLVSGYISKFVRSKERHTVLGGALDSRLVDAISELCYELNMSLRDIQESLRVYGHCMMTTVPDTGESSYGFARAAFFMCACSIKLPDLFRALGERKITVDEFKSRIDFITQNCSETSKEMWAKTLLICYLAFSFEGVGKLTSELARLGLYWVGSEEALKKAENNVSGWCQAWNLHFGQTNWFGEIYQAIVGIKRFGH